MKNVILSMVVVTSATACGMSTEELIAYATEVSPSIQRDTCHSELRVAGKYIYDDRNKPEMVIEKKGSIWVATWSDGVTATCKITNHSVSIGKANRGWVRFHAKTTTTYKDSFLVNAMLPLTERVSEYVCPEGANTSYCSTYKPIFTD